MHIVLFHDSFLPPKTYGGIERIVVALAREYLARGHQVSLLCRKGSKVSGCNIIEIGPQGVPADVSVLLPSGVDFLHSHQPLAVPPNIPYLVSIHGNGHLGERYLPNTNFLSQSHARNHNSNVYVFNGVDTSRFPMVEKKSDYFIFLARTTWRVKNVKTAIRWAKDLKVKLKIIGGGGISLDRNIEFLGLVDEEKKVDVLSHARALIYPTNWDEPCAGAPLEAFACGTPVISSVNGCMPEMIVSEKMGVVCQNYDQLLSAVTKESLWSYNECRKMAETRFSVERMASDYLDLYKKIITTGVVGDKNASVPKYNFDKKSVNLLYKPTLRNKAKVWLTGKV